MLVWLSRRVVKDAWYVVGTWAALAVILLAVSLSGLGGTGLFDRLKTGNSSVTVCMIVNRDDLTEALARLELEGGS